MTKSKRPTDAEIVSMKDAMPNAARALRREVYASLDDLVEEIGR